MIETPSRSSDRKILGQRAPFERCPFSAGGQLPRRASSGGRSDGITFAENFRRHPLANLALGQPVFEEQRIRVGVDVDEAGRDHQSGRVNFMQSRAPWNFADRGDAVPFDGNVSIEPGVPGSIHDPAVPHDQIVARLLLHFSPAPVSNRF